MKDKFLYYLPSIIFNIAEIVVSIIVGYLLRCKFEDMIISLLLFNLIRNLSKTPIHYKSCILCFIWTEIFYITLFYLSKMNFKVMIICDIFYGIILTNKGDLMKNFQNFGLWGGNSLNKEVMDWVMHNQNNLMLYQYEKNLYNLDKIKYKIFEYRFREARSYNEISDLMNMDIQRINEEIKTITHFIKYSIILNEYE